MGITSVYKSGDSNTYNDENLSLAIGGLSRGITPLEMSVAYGSISNGGETITPTFYSKIEDSNGNVVMTPNQNRTRAISTQNAYITSNILQEPVKGGTASYCAIPGIDVAAKTGTTDEEKDRWLCGFTPYYAAACWYGYDQPEYVSYSGASTNPAGDLWDAVMTKIHQGKAAATFTRPDGIVTATVCRASGCLASEGCADTYEEIFTSDNMPPRCEGHGSQTICLDSGKEATQYCTNVEVRNFGSNVPKEKLNLWKPVNGVSASGSRVEETCDIHTKPAEQPKQETKPAETTPTQPTQPAKQNNTSTDTNTTNTSNTTNTNTTPDSSSNTSTNTNTTPGPTPDPTKPDTTGGDGT